MKIFTTPTSVLSLLLTAPFLKQTSATCTTDDAVCQPESGSCLPAILAFLNPDAEFVDLDMGRYCGNGNFCRPVMGSNETDDNTCEQGSDNCPVEACDAVDGLCKAHHECLWQVTAPEVVPVTQIDVPDRCRCDAELVASSAVVAVTTDPTGTCDAAYYTQPLPIFLVTAASIVRHEAILVSVTWCCNVLDPVCAQDAIDNDYQDTWETAKAFCDTAIADLEDSGFSLPCDALTEPPSVPPSMTPSMSAGASINQGLTRVWWVSAALVALVLFT